MEPVVIEELEIHTVIYRDITVFSAFHRCQNLVRHAEKPLPHIEEMLALIDQQTAVLSLPCASPGRGIVIGRSTEPDIGYPHSAVKPPQFSTLDHLLCTEKYAVHPCIKDHSQTDSRAVCRIYESLHFLRRYPSRLIQQDMLSRRGRHLSDLDMGGVRCHDNYSIKFVSACEHRLHIRIDRCPRIDCPDLILPLFISAANSGEYHTIDFTVINHLYVLAAHTAKSNHCGSDFLHRPAPSSNRYFIIFDYNL